MQIDTLYSKLRMAVGEDNALENQPMSAHTTFKIGGNADIFVIPQDENAFVDAVNLCRGYAVPFFILGNGSNLLVSDNGIEGVVISTEKITRITVLDDFIEAQCGAMLAKVSSVAQQNALSGLEFASGIPGTLGGAIYMNAGAYGEEMHCVVEAVRVLCSNGDIKEYKVEECDFGYRASRFQKDGALILSVKMHLKSGNQQDIMQKCKELNSRRREKQPIEMPSAGSVFKRPEGHFAGTLIEQSGLKGYRIGGAEVSEKHAGFIVNAGGATANDVLELVEYIKKVVKKKTGVELHEEIKLIGR